MAGSSELRGSAELPGSVGESRPYVVGVDSGGSHTRVLCLDLAGHELARAVTGGGSPNHNDDAEEQVVSGVRAALTAGGLAPGAAVALVAGMAGVDAEQDLEWAEGYFAQLSCVRRIHNDAVVAHAGALSGRPGVIVVAGTGSVIMAIDGSGREVRNDRYRHYAGGARHLAYDAVARILTDSRSVQDEGYVTAVLDRAGAGSATGASQQRLAALRRRLAELERDDPNEVKRWWGRLAPLVTAAADTAPLADAACRRLAEETATGVRLVAHHVGGSEVQVSTAGALACDPAFTTRLAAALAETRQQRLVLVPPAASPVDGAALLALRWARS